MVAQPGGRRMRPGRRNLATPGGCAAVSFAASAVSPWIGILLVNPSAVCSTRRTSFVPVSGLTAWLMMPMPSPLNTIIRMCVERAVAGITSFNEDSGFEGFNDAAETLRRAALLPGLCVKAERAIWRLRGYLLAAIPIPSGAHSIAAVISNGGDWKAVSKLLPPCPRGLLQAGPLAE